MFSVLHLPPPPTSFRRTGFLLGSTKMAPHSCQELPVWDKDLGPARAARCGWAEPLTATECYFPSTSLCARCLLGMGSQVSSSRSGSNLLGGSQILGQRGQLAAVSETQTKASSI